MDNHRNSSDNFDNRNTCKADYSVAESEQRNKDDDVSRIDEEANSIDRRYDVRGLISKFTNRG